MPNPFLEYQASPRKRKIGPLRPLFAAVAVSVMFGLLWELLAVKLLQGHFEDVVDPSFLIAGVFTGIAAGLFTVWTRHLTSGRESLMWTIATYYLGIICFGFALLAANLGLREKTF